jgi:hypothetical protein
VEFEKELSFSALDQVLFPLLHRLPGLEQGTWCPEGDLRINHTPSPRSRMGGREALTELRLDERR